MLQPEPYLLASPHLLGERLVFYCRTTSASTAPRTPRRTCCPYAYVLITVLRVSRSCELFQECGVEGSRAGGGRGATGVVAARTVPGKVDVRLPGKGNSNTHGARPVHLIISMIKWIRTSRLSITL